MSVSELKARFNSSGGSAPQSPGTAFGPASEVHHQPTASTAAAASGTSHQATPSRLPAVLAGPRPFGSFSSSSKPAVGGGAGGRRECSEGGGESNSRNSSSSTTTTRLSTAGAFGVVLKQTSPSHRAIDLDVNDNAADADRNAANSAAATASSPTAAAADDSASSAAAASVKATATASAKAPSGVASSVAKLPSASASKPLPTTAKPTIPAAAAAAAAAAGTASGVASGKPALTSRPVGLHVPGASKSGSAGAGAATALSPVLAARVAALSPTSGTPPGGPAVEKQTSPTVVLSPMSPTHPTASPPSLSASPDSSESGAPEDSVAGRLEAIKRRLRPVTITTDDAAGRSSVDLSKPVSLDVSPSRRLPSQHVGTAEALVTDASGAKFRKVQFVVPREAAAPAKPGSLVDCQLPLVTWAAAAAADGGSAVVSRTALSDNAVRAVSLIAPTTEEEEYDEGSSGSCAASGGSVSSQQHPTTVPSLPPRINVAAAATTASISVTSSDVVAGDLYDEGVSVAADDDDGPFEEYDDVSAAPPIPQRNPALRANTDTVDAAKRRKEEEDKRRKEEEDKRRKEEEDKRRKEEERKQKEEEKRQKAKEKEEKREREKREKEAKKKEADLQKLLASFKVSAANPPVCEATVTADYLEPGKNELPVKCGDRLFILAKDTKGKCLAKSCSSGAIGVVASSIINELENRSDEDEAMYAEADDVYSELD